MSDHVLKDIVKESDIEKKFKILHEYVSYLNPTQAAFLKKEFDGMNREEKKQLMMQTERRGIYIHEPPFFGNTQFDEFVKLFKDHPEWCEKYKFKNIEKPMVMGDLYFIRLILAFKFLIAGNSLEPKLLT